MGLLHKIASKSISELDDMGKILRDRILQLAQKGVSPYTVLSLLKAYGSFRIGICLSLANDQYVGYASVGLGIEKTHIPLERMPAPLTRTPQIEREEAPRKIYYKIEAPEMLSIKAIDSQADAWVFPLDDREPCKSILLLVAEENVQFNPQIIARLLSDIRKVLIQKQEVQEVLESLIPKQEKGAKLVQLETAVQECILDKTAITKEVKNTIIKYQKIHPSFQGIILESPHILEEGEKNHFGVHISQMVTSFGSVIPLSPARSLVLFQKSMDRELIAHRLSKSLGLILVLDFEADTAEGAFAVISPCW